MKRDKKKVYTKKEKNWIDKFVSAFSGDSLEDRYLKQLHRNKDKKKKGQ